jgi:transposase-like protein
MGEIGAHSTQRPYRSRPTSKKRKCYSAEFKQDGVSQIAQAKTITGLAKELVVRRKFLYLWRDQLQTGRAALERRRGRPPGSHRKLFAQQRPMQLNCGSLSWSGC